MSAARFATRAQLEALAVLRVHKELKLYWVEGVYIGATWKNVGTLEALVEKGYLVRATVPMDGREGYQFHPKPPRTNDELAFAIKVKLQDWEKDPEINTLINPERSLTLKRYYEPHVYAAGGKIRISYISYQGFSSMTREQAEKYLEHIEAGYVGRHYKVLEMI